MAPTGLRFLTGNQNQVRISILTIFPWKWGPNLAFQVDLETYKKSSVEGSASNSFSGNAFGQQAMGKASESSPQAWGRENKGRSSPSWGTSTTSWDSTSCSKGSMNSWSCGFGSKSKEEAASRGWFKNHSIITNRYQGQTFKILAFLNWSISFCFPFNKNFYFVLLWSTFKLRLRLEVPVDSDCGKWKYSLFVIVFPVHSFITS